MSRYVIQSKPRSFYVEDDIYDAPVSMGTPQVCDHVPTDTGLLDADGNAIWRVPDPIGFVF